MILLLLLVSACGKESYYKEVPEPDYWPTQEWKLTSPEKQGMSSRELGKALDYITDKQLDIHSLLIIRHGYVVLDAAFYPYPGNVKHDVASVTKSVTATLMGQAVDSGLFKSIDQPVHELLEAKHPIWGADKSTVSLKHLITMSSGFDCGYKEGEVELIEMVATDNWLNDILKLPMRQKPGQRFAYCSGNMHLLSALLQAESGMNTIEFARKHLFAPLGIDEVYWPEDPQGITRGWGDLKLKPKDMAKIGFLYLHGGQWNGRRILSEDWVTLATTPQVTIQNGKTYYGYGWWLHDEGTLKLFAARGRGGQRIAVWPEEDIIIVTTGGGVEPDQLMTFIVNAIQSRSALKENPSSYNLLQQKVLTAMSEPKPEHSTPWPSTPDSFSYQKYVLDRNPLQIKQFGLNVISNEVNLEVLANEQSYIFPVGLGGVYHITSDGPNRASVGLKGMWTDENTFTMDYHEIDGINHFLINVKFLADKVHLEFRDPTGYYNIRVNGYPR